MDNDSCASCNFGYRQGQYPRLIAPSHEDEIDKKEPTIEESSHHNECVYVCKFHNPCEIWCGFRIVSKFSMNDNQRLRTSDEEVHHQGQPF
jgi:hypothetical protein